MGEVSGEIYPGIADWLYTSLMQGRPNDYNQSVYVEGGTTISDYHHG